MLETLLMLFQLRQVTVLHTTVVMTRCPQGTIAPLHKVTQVQQQLGGHLISICSLSKGAQPVWLPFGNTTFCVVDVQIHISLPCYTAMQTDGHSHASFAYAA